MTFSISAAQLGKVKVSGNTAAVRVTCNGASACSFALQLSVTATRKGGSVGAVTARKAKTTEKTVVVGTGGVSLSGGQTKTIQIKLKVTLAVMSAGKPVSHTTVTFNHQKTKK